ncbi:MAG: MFS transporter [Armatimonadota bacterium]
MGFVGAESVYATMTTILADRTVRRMILLLLVTEFLWGMGCFFVPMSTTIPAYVRSLGGTPAIIGVLAVTIGALPLMLQLFGRNAIERFRHRQRGIFALHILCIIPYALIGGLDFFFARQHPVAMIWITIALLAFSQIIIGLIIPVWLDMVARVIPPEIRGRYFGIASALFAAGGILGGFGLTALQRWLGDAGIFRGAFFMAAVCYVISMTAFIFAPIPTEAFEHAPEPSVLTRARKAFAASHPSTDFGRLVISYCAQALAVAIVPFLVVYASDHQGGLGLPTGVFTQITVWQAFGGAIGGVIIGWFVDHRGPRWPWVVVTLFIPLIVLLYPYGGKWSVLAFCSLLVGVLNTHWSVVGPAMLELSPEGDKSGYVAIANMASFLPATVGPLLFAFLIKDAGYQPAFIAAAICGLAAFLPALTIRNRAARQMHHLDDKIPTP